MWIWSSVFALPALLVLCHAQQLEKSLSLTLTRADVDVEPSSPRFSSAITLYIDFEK